MRTAIVVALGSAVSAVAWRAAARDRTVGRLHTLVGLGVRPEPRPTIGGRSVPVALAASLRSRGAGWRAPERVRHLARWARQRQQARLVGRALDRELSLVAEILRLSLAAGLTPSQALRAVSPVAPERTRPLFTRAVRDLELGLTLRDAVDRMAVDAPATRPLVTALAASEDGGVAVDAELQRVAAEARAAWRRTAESRARTVPVRLLFPLVFLVLPAFLLLGIAPALLAGFGGTQGTPAPSCDGLERPCISVSEPEEDLHD